MLGLVRLSEHTGRSTINPPKTLLRNCIVAYSAGYRLAELCRKRVSPSNLQVILPGWPIRCLLIRWRRYERTPPLHSDGMRTYKCFC